MASTSDSQRTIAQKTWELSNNILEIAPGEEIYKYDRQQQQQMLAAKPWEKDHHFFKDIKVNDCYFYVSNIRGEIAHIIICFCPPYKLYYL